MPRSITRLGAVVVTADTTPIYLDGISAWNRDTVGREVTATGVLRQRKLAPSDGTELRDEVTAGIGDDSFVLENPAWTAER